MSITLDAELHIPVLSKVCTFCKHFRRALMKKRACDAFPNGIPMPIWMGENNHSQPYLGDHGLQFELAPDANPEAWEHARTVVG